MAIGRLSIKSGSKGKALAHAKYILREDKYAKQIEKKGEKLEAIGHGNMPAWAKDNPNFFWQMADEMERKNGSVYREHIITLPRELNEAQRHELIKDWIKNEIGDSHPYSYAIHNPPSMDGGEQPHCHLMFCERTLDGIERQPDQFFKRYNAKQPEKGGAKKANTGLDYATRKEQIKDLRDRWEKTCNRHLLKVSKFVQISMKSLKDRGVERQPTNISMAEMNKPEVKQAYKDHLQARQAFTQSFQAIQQGMNVQAELAKAPTQPPAPQPKNQIDELWEQARAEREAFKEKLDIAEKRTQKPLEKQKEISCSVVPPTHPKAPPAPQKTPQQVQAERMATLEQAQQTIKQWEAVLSQKAEAMKSATIGTRTKKFTEADKALNDHTAKKPKFFGVEKWETTKTELETAKEKAEIALAQATGDKPYHLRYVKIEPIDYEKHALARLDQDPATKAQHEASDKAKQVAQRILEQMANEKAQQHGADIHAKQGVTYHGKVLRADKNGILQQTGEGIVYHPPLASVKEGKNYNLTPTSNTMYDVQEAMEIRIAQKSQEQDRQR